MKAKTFVLFIAAFCVAIVASCAGPTMKTNFTAGTYALNVNKIISNPKAAYIRLVEARLNDEPVKETTVGGSEMRQGVYEFAALLENSGLFNSVEVVDDQSKTTIDQDSLFIEVSLAMEEHTHSAAAGGKAFASGFFTLGIVPITIDYSCSSRMAIHVLRRNVEILSTSSLKSAEASSSHSYYASSPLAERPVARKFVRNENNKALVDYLVKNSGKIYNEQGRAE